MDQTTQKKMETALQYADTSVATARRNKELLDDLIRAHGAKSLIKTGNVTLSFFETDPSWFCPCCFRNKYEISRLDKNGFLLCCQHLHHDHMYDYFKEIVFEVSHDLWTRLSIEFKLALKLESFCRFEEKLICADCNISDTSAKNIVGAGKYFSFSPNEISRFAIPENHKYCGIKNDVAKDIYKIAEQQVKIHLKTAEQDWIDLVLESKSKLGEG